MGVPVITCPGATFASRLAASHLHAAGLAQFVAADRAGYVDLAARWAGDLEQLRTLRAELPERVARSPLVDAVGFTKHLTEELRKLWRQQTTVRG